MDLMELSRRLDLFNRRLNAIMGNPDNLSASGLAIAISLLVTMNAETLREAADVIRARAASGGPHDQ